MRIAVVVFEGFDELDALGPLEVLRNAATMGDVDLEVELVTLDGGVEVTGSHGLRVRPDGRLGPPGRHAPRRRRRAAGLRRRGGRGQGGRRRRPGHRRRG